MAWSCWGQPGLPPPLAHPMHMSLADDAARLLRSSRHPHTPRRARLHPRKHDAPTHLRRAAAPLARSAAAACRLQHPVVL